MTMDALHPLTPEQKALWATRRVLKEQIASLKLALQTVEAQLKDVTPPSGPKKLMKALRNPVTGQAAKIKGR